MDERDIIFIGSKRIEFYIETILQRHKNVILKARGTYRPKAEDVALIGQREYGLSISKIDLYDAELIMGSDVKFVSAIDIYIDNNNDIQMEKNYG